MLQYRGDHVEGPWHGGGWVPDPGSPNPDVLDLELVCFFRPTGDTTGDLVGTWHIGRDSAGVFAGLRGAGSATCGYERDAHRTSLRCTLVGTGHFPG